MNEFPTINFSWLADTTAHYFHKPALSKLLKGGVKSIILASSEAKGEFMLAMGFHICSHETFCSNSTVATERLSTCKKWKPIPPVTENSRQRDLSAVLFWCWQSPQAFHIGIDQYLISRLQKLQNGPVHLHLAWLFLCRTKNMTAWKEIARFMSTVASNYTKRGFHSQNLNVVECSFFPLEHHPEEQE